jgi:AraC-like DNA-binding protein
MKSDLADLLGVNNPEIARLLNESIGMNFFEYVNYYRIREFLELAKTEKAKTLTFFGLAQEAGFNSKTTFNKSFKKIMGSSPREYFTHQLN